MTFEDRIRFLSRRPGIKALLNFMRENVPVLSRERKLEMPILETERLILRKLNPEDVRDIITWENQPGAQTTEAEARSLLDYCYREYRERGIGPWGMQVKETGAVVGNCGFPHIAFRNHCGEVNYYVSAKHRGLGLAPEATRALLGFGFGEIGLTRIQARCEADNLRSERVMLKLGMKFEGLIDDLPTSKDPLPKKKLYAILEKDYKRVATEGKRCG